MGKTIIDDFNSTNNGPILVQGSDPGPKSVVDDGGKGTLGGFRNATVSFITGEQSAIVSYAISGSQCSFNFGPARSEAELTVLWDADGKGLGADFSGYKELFVDVGFLDHANVPVTLTLHSRGQTYNLQRSIRRTDASTVHYPLARFSPRPDAKALANVSAVEMQVEGKTNMDLGIANVGATG